MKIFSDVRVAHHLRIGLLVAAATFGFATSAQARVLLGSPGPAALSNGLVGYWPLDGSVTNWTSNTTRDLSGNGNTARFYLVSTSTSPVSGKIGQAIHPNGNITVPHSTSINLGSTLSVSFWIKGTAKAPWDELIEKTVFATEWLIQNADSNASRDLYVRMDTSAGGNQNCTAPVGITNVLDGTWHHVVLVITNGTCTLYKDSVRGTPGTFNVGTGFANPGVDLTFEGGDSDSTDSTYDDVRLYNRALTATEVKQLYSLGAATMGHSNTVALSNGLVGYWTFDGSATNWRTNTTADLSGQGNTGNLVSLGTTTAPVAGKIGQALQFNGSSGYVVGSSVVNIAKTTVAAWVKVTRYPTAKAIVAGFIQGLGNTTCDKDLVIGSDGKLYFYVFDGIARTTSARSSAIPLNTWVYVVGTADGTNARTYVNGAEVGITAAGNTHTSYSVPNIFINGISGSAVCGTVYLNGSVDDVRIHDRALSAGEVKQLYNTGAANVGHSNAGITNGLVGHWTFDGSVTNWATGQTRDLSGNGNFGGLSTLSTSTTPVAGKIGQAFTFNGSQAVRIEDSPSLDVGDIVSYSMWIKRARTGALEVFFSKDFNAAVGAFQSNNRVALHKSAAGLVLETTATITDTKFHHLVFTKDGAAVRIYIDGSLAASTNSASAFFANNDRPLCLGLDSSSAVCGTNPFKGVIDDFRVYNRELSAAEVKQLYNAGK